MLDKLAEDIAKYPIEIKSGRSYPRNVPRDMKFYDRIKSVM